MGHVLEYLRQLLESVDANIYHISQPTKAKLPYCTYRLPYSHMDSDGLAEEFTMEVNLWGERKHNVDIIQKEDLFTKALNKVHTVNEHCLIKVTFNGRYQIDDANPMIRRDELKFKVKVYFTE